MSNTGSRTILSRYFERLFPFVPRYPALSVGDVGEPPLTSTGRGAPDMDWPTGSTWTQIDAADATSILWLKTAPGVAGWAKYATVLAATDDTALSYAEAAQDAADAAQADVDTLRAEFDAQTALIGDLTTIVGGEAPPGSPATVVAAIEAIEADVAALTGHVIMDATVAPTDASNGAATGLSLAVTAGTTYMLEWWIYTTTSSATIAARWSVRSSDAAGTIAVASRAVMASGQQSGYAAALNDWTAETNGPGSDKILEVVQALFTCTTSGTIELYIRPEVEGGTATAHAGSVLMHRKVTT